MAKVKLLLEDAKEFIGQGLGPSKEAIGEIVFNTSMTGYQEILTDPSYAGQIITLTYPEIGNYGCNDATYESATSFASGLVIKNYSPVTSNWSSEYSLEEFLQKHDIPAIYDIDTRELTKYIRDKGAMRSIIAPVESDSQALLKRLQAIGKMEGTDLAKEVSCKEKYKFPCENKKYKIIAFDFGIKTNILRQLAALGCDIEVVPANTSAEYVMKENPDGVFLSNGPGDPAAVSYAIETIKTLVKDLNKPIFGICLGHQLLALAAGAKSFKLKFGHRGANQPIKNLETSKIEIASHNHGFAISKENLPDELVLTHININDNTVAGLKFKSKPIFSVQYHPEACPGPHDSHYLFGQFIEMLAV